MRKSKRGENMNGSLKNTFFTCLLVSMTFLPLATFGQSLLPGVHPAFRMTSLRPAGFNPRVGGIDFLPNGDLVISTWDGFGTTTSFPGRVFILKNVSGGYEQKVISIF